MQTQGSPPQHGFQPKFLPPATESKYFSMLPKRPGLLKKFESHNFNLSIFSWDSEKKLVTPEKGTTFVYVNKGPTLVMFDTEDSHTISVNVSNGMFFSVPGKAIVSGGEGLAINQEEFKGMFSCGGPIENFGRLKYIDGCTDTVLISPLVKGNPCLNHLHFPKGIVQTQHTHPSIRVGVVAKGYGRCEVPGTHPQDPVQVIPMLAGSYFYIPADSPHAFFTDDSEMDIIAFHPDSDVGPDHDLHPMVSRTVVNGTSAIFHPSIRTK